ncbi:MAG: transglutaminase domain-containing protein [Lachnospiraceae bacterium]
MKIDNRNFLFLLEKKKKGGTILPIILCVVLVAGLFGSGFLAGVITGQSSILTSGGEKSGIGSYAASGENSGTSLATAGNRIDEATAQGSPASENGTGSGENGFSGTEYVTGTYLASQMKDKYKDETSPYGYTYGPAITGLSRNDEIVLEVGFDLEKLDLEYWTEIINLYEDPALNSSIGPSRWEYDKEAGTVTLYPTSYARGQVAISMLSTDVVRRYSHDDLFFFPEDAGTSWGNLSTLYLATYIDLETGEKRDVPQVQMVSFKGELQDTPRLEYSFTDDGRIHFEWTRVEGAKEYFVCEIEYDEVHGYSTNMYVIATTEDTQWTSEAAEYGSVTTNWRFNNYSVAQNDWYDEWCREQRIAEYGEEPISVYKTENRDNYCVIAICEEGTSMMSNCVDILDIQANLPVSIATDTWVENGYQYSGYESVEEMSAYSYVTMADGMTSMKLVDYDTEKAVIVEDRYIYTDEDGNYLEGKNLKVLKIPYRIEGTPFEDTVSIVDYDESRLEKDLAFLEEREEMLRKRAGDIVLSTDITFEEEETSEEESNVRKVDFEVTANSALSEYLALSMLSGVTVIDISEFPEAADPHTLSDSLLEAYYQNPLILGISGYRTNISGTAVKVVYDDDAEVTAKKQEEIRQKVEEIIAEIITPGMTELEKELAINEYLCNTCEYDNEALENAAEHDYAYVDSEFDDSFTAYGAIINGRCVCAGYAGAFKILADAAGLDSVVVTGMLDGNLPHAWNKVRIDGEWLILDVTNNDSDYLVNALLNLPDEAGRRTLTEDSDYVLDGCMRNYVATNGQREYYRLNNLYFPYDEVSEQLTEQLNENGTALLRTEYTLDDETFDRIAQEVYEGMDEGTELYGYYWMGVIYLTAKE